MQVQHAVEHFNRLRHERKTPKKQLWFKCRHALPEAVNLEDIRGNHKMFNVFIRHALFPISVQIKKIRHLKLSRRFGKRVELTLEHKRRDKFFKLTVIYNRDNGSMVIAPVPKILFQ